MRWEVRKRSEWHKWFTWYPISFAGQWVWLERVERMQLWDGQYWRWTYRYV